MKEQETIFPKIRVPVNIDFDWTEDPTQQAEYANPVTLNNHEVRLANAAIEITEALVGVIRKIGTCKAQLGAAKDALDDFERQTLDEFPAPPSATKSTKLLQAYLYRVTHDAGKREHYLTLERSVRDLTQQLRVLEVKAEAAQTVLQTIKLSGEHIQTHLAFVKAEAKQLRNF